MKHIKLFEDFNEEPDIHDLNFYALQTVITHLGEVEKVDIDPKWNTNNLIKLNRLEKRDYTNVEQCEEHLNAQGFFLHIPPNRVPGDFIIVGVGESIKEWSINWLNLNFGNLTIEKDDKVYYVDNESKCFFYYYKKHQESKKGYYNINYYRIWSLFESNFGLAHKTIEYLMTIWLRDTYNLSELTPTFFTSLEVTPNNYLIGI